ncbi:MAG: phosphotransferase [Planctomycetota bacterium]
MTPVLECFALGGDVFVLQRGRAPVVRCGDVVLKRGGDEAWPAVAPCLSEISPRDVRLAHPVRATDGRWIVDGWFATRFIEGEPGVRGREREALAACRAMHRALKRVATREAEHVLRGSQRDAWRVADAIAWGEVPIDAHLGPPVADRLEQLRVPLEPIDLPDQLIHSDPGGGNLLFAPGLAPGFIDFSPAWRPGEYASAILLADAVAWGGSNPEVMVSGRDDESFDQLVLRAVLFRVIVGGLREGELGFEGERRAYAAVLEAIGVPSDSS